MNDYWQFAGFTVSLAVEVYFFLMQRVPLEVCRENDIDPAVGRMMLPTWFSVAWLAKLSKWVFLGLIWWRSGWVFAVGCLLVSFFLGMIVPIPYTHFANLLERRLERERDGPNFAVAGQLLIALKTSRDEHGF
jgi:hypothetical protein